MSAIEHVEMQLAAGADEVVLTAGEAYELLWLVDGISPEDRQAFLAESATPPHHSTSKEPV